MDMYKKYGVTNKEIQGVWIEFEPGGMAFMCRSSNLRANTQLKAETDRLMRSHGKRIVRGDMTPEQTDDINIKAFVKCVLLGWRKLPTEDGGVLEFSPDNAIALFKKIPKLFDELSDRVGEDSRYSDEDVEEEAKN